MALQDILDSLNAAEADKQALVDARNALAASQANLDTVTSDSATAVQGAQADVDAKSQAVTNAASKLSGDRSQIEDLITAELGPLAAPPAGDTT